jgi:DNA-binding protein HU-beta
MTQEAINVNQGDKIMNKSEMIKHIAETASLSQTDAAKALDAFCSGVKTVLKEGQQVVLTGFGSFSSVERAARKGRNPKSGAEIMIPAKNIIKFSAGKDFKDAVN